MEYTPRPTVCEILAKLANGTMTVNQARIALGLPPIEGGDDEDEEATP